MGLFLTLLLKITPLYLNIVLGYISVKILNIKRESIANLVIYILAPIVVFSATISVKIDYALISLPLFFFAFCSFTAILTYTLCRKYWSDATSNILAFSAGTSNAGYTGIPLALIFFDHTLADIYIFTMLGFIFYGNTTGFYISAKGNFTVKQSLLKVVKLPILYAFILGLILNINGVSIPKELFIYTSQFKGAYGILGMMILGMSLVGLRKSSDLDKKFITISFFIKFIYWPLAILFFIYLDKTIFNLYNSEIYKMMFLFSILPLANNSVTLAILHGIKPEKASITILLSTIFSIIYIPIMLVLYGGFN